jgi:hypothetical protein
MIDVYSQGVNAIYLKGNPLEQNARSTIFYSPNTKWNVALHVERDRHIPLLHRDNLDLKQVIPAMEEMLSSYGFSCSFNVGEITRYMDIIQRDFGPHGRYAEPS